MNTALHVYARLKVKGTVLRGFPHKSTPGSLALRITGRAAAAGESIARGWCPKHIGHGALHICYCSMRQITLPAQGLAGALLSIHPFASLRGRCARLLTSFWDCFYDLSSQCVLMHPHEASNLPQAAGRMPVDRWCQSWRPCCQSTRQWSSMAVQWPPLPGNCMEKETQQWRQRRCWPWQKALSRRPQLLQRRPRWLMRFRAASTDPLPRIPLSGRGLATCWACISPR